MSKRTWNVAFFAIVIVGFLAWQNWNLNNGTVVVHAQVVQHGIRISWTAVTKDANGNTITGVQYNAYRGTAAGQTTTQIATAIPASPYQDTSGVPGTTYFYAVTATAPGYSESLKSNEVSATFPLVQAGTPAGAAATSF